MEEKKIKEFTATSHKCNTIVETNYCWYDPPYIQHWFNGKSRRTWPTAVFASLLRLEMKFTKEEIDEIKDALEDSQKYYKDLLNANTSDPETNKMNIEYARPRIKIIESIKRKLK